MNDRQKDAIIALLWDYMKRDPEHSNRVQTGWGTKTQEGLENCIERICKDDNLP